VAAPILDAHGQPLAAVTIMAPLARLPQEGFAARGDLCIQAAHAIEAALEA
jgi:DNA-binding IclR family transcriptional regulator